LLVADWETASKASEAENALGRLEGVARDLPNQVEMVFLVSCHHNEKLFLRHALRSPRLPRGS
jgi:hypothetical protein